MARYQRLLRTSPPPRPPMPFETYPHEGAIMPEFCLREIEKNGGFLTEESLRWLVRIDRMRPVLVRLRDGNRFVAPAQCVEELILAVEKSGLEYVRDVSLAVKS